MNRLKLIVNTWKAWLISWKQTKRLIISSCALLFAFLTLTAFVQPNIVDRAHILDHQTRQLIIAKNNRYLQTKEQPQIAVITVNRLNHLTPRQLNDSKRMAYIVVGQKGKKRNVQIYSTADLHSAFTADSRLNIIRAEVNQLRSPHPQKFNQGLRFVFRACATKIDQQYQYSLDKYDLSSAEQNKISHPHRLALPIALALAFLILILVYFFRRLRQQKRTDN